RTGRRRPAGRYARRFRHRGTPPPRWPALSPRPPRVGRGAWSRRPRSRPPIPDGGPGARRGPPRPPAGEGDGWTGPRDRPGRGDPAWPPERPPAPSPPESVRPARRGVAGSPPGPRPPDSDGAPAPRSSRIPRTGRGSRSTPCRDPGPDPPDRGRGPARVGPPRARLRRERSIRPPIPPGGP